MTVQQTRSDYAHAKVLLRESLELRRTLFPGDHPKIFGSDHLIVAGGLSNWAESLRLAGDPRGAEALLRESLAIYSKALPSGPWRVATTETLLARCLVPQARFAEAERLLITAHPSVEKQFGADDQRTTRVVEAAVSLYEAWGRPDKAAEWREKLPRTGASAP